MLDSSSIPLTKKPHFDSQSESCHDGRKSSGGESDSSSYSRRKGGSVVGIPDVLQSPTSLTSSVVQASTLL